MILDQAFKYITELKRQNDELLLNGGNNEQGKDLKILHFCCFFSVQVFVSQGNLHEDTEAFFDQKHC